MRGILKDNVQFTKDGEILFGDKYNSLGTDEKIITILVSKRVLNLTIGIPEKIGPKEIEELTGFPHGTVTTSLKRLGKKRVVKSDSGKYWVPNYAISKIGEIFDGK